VSPPVRAAGGVVVRGAPADRQVLLVHRPRYDDWTFPKGKAEPGESDEDCALREVAEETSLHCTLVRELASTSYRDSRGRRKVVRYWVMDAGAAEPAPANEVDEVRWLRPEQAARLLSYERDLALLDAL
jgi:8-oxo-dGTP pyrophosphatase MutT (NUDIX family)